MNPTSKPITITLGGKPLQLFFDLNTFVAFEEATGKFFLDFLASLQEAVVGVATSATSGKENGDAQAAVSSAFGILRKLSLKDIRAFLWAAHHTYDKSNEPTWPMTISQIGQLVDVNNIGVLLPQLLRANVPNLQPANPEAPERPTEGEEAQALPQNNGGNGSGLSDAAILDSLTPRSADSLSVDSGS